MRTIAGRILAVTVTLVIATALVAGVATVVFARAAARTEQRGELRAQATLIAVQSVRALTEATIARLTSDLDGTTLAAYGPQGRLIASSGAMPARVARRSAAAAEQAIGGTIVSTQVKTTGGDLLVEARPSSDGGAIVLTRKLTTFTQNSAVLVAGILITLGISMLLAVAAAFWLARRISGPLAATASAARRMAAGERAVPVPSSSLAEVADVGDALRALDAALGTSEGRQREFLLSVSHEIRTPLTALRGYGEALADGLVPVAETRGVGATLVAETSRLEHFTADLLELARLEADDFSVVAAPFPVAEVADEVVTAWSARAAALEVAIAVAGTGGVVLADRRRVRQVVDGLVENALRATPAGGSVTLLLERDAIAVEDTGAGLSDDDLRDAFQRGLLRERYRETRAVGTGLGLSIATRLASRMGGAVTASHAAGHAGARFTLRLPAA